MDVFQRFNPTDINTPVTTKWMASAPSFASYLVTEKAPDKLDYLAPTECSSTPEWICELCLEQPLVEPD